MERIENRTFDELKIGDSASLVHTLTYKDIQLFAAMSGDVNPAHVDPAFAKDDMFHKVIAHGMWGGALISTVLGTELPGPGAIYLGRGDVVSERPDAELAEVERWRAAAPALRSRCIISPPCWCCCAT